ncbi:hypothetical protein MSP7336_01818 [Mycobacterium shimoidei]|uniref:DNA-binding phage zinc finger domain-containing protein n=1 Tax=Mycobacterium shimoidei TaxID=29313 RepID=A0A375YXI3_MYCSH|nr:hypothetical protein [Mycobacterium shimoidei]SRX93579.1 hypothetical protein MSP7336_01818 [Mycobacterium shimoidei]
MSQISPLVRAPESPHIKLANPSNPFVRDALTRKCPLCSAEPHARCRRNDGRQLQRRIVHYARIRFPHPGGLV